MGVPPLTSPGYLSDELHLSLVVRRFIPAEDIVEPDFRLLLPSWHTPLINRLRLATHQTPIDAAHPFPLEDWQVRLKVAAPCACHGFAAEQGSPVLFLIFDLPFHAGGIAW